MFALAFRFPARRYHATPWGRNVNEADVAWPPEPWRLLRALIAAYWRKGDRDRWQEEHLAELIDVLAGSLPVYCLPEGAVHAHARHYVPMGTMDKGREKTSLVFDAFVRLPERGTLVAAWPDMALEGDLFSFAADLAAAIGYLGRAESWTECTALADWRDDANCGPVSAGFSGDPVRLLAPLKPDAYAAERGRLIQSARERICALAKRPPPASQLERKVAEALRSRRSGLDTLPVRLVDALSLDTGDFQDRGWSRPPAAREVVYARDARAATGVSARSTRRRGARSMRRPPATVARFLLAGRPRPRVEDTVKIAELMRRAALAQFGWRLDVGGRRMPNAPWQISGRDANGGPLKDPAHVHAFWLPEDADSDGLIDHVSVFIASGIEEDIKAKLDGITRLWLPANRRGTDDAEDGAATEWRLALEGFGRPADFGDGSPIFRVSSRWRSATPLFAAGHLKAAGYAGEVRRLVRRRGLDVQLGFPVDQLVVTGSPPDHEAVHNGVHFSRFRSRGQERRRDSVGALLDITFPTPVEGPIVLGYGSHFGLGLFVALDGTDPNPAAPATSLGTD